MTHIADVYLMAMRPTSNDLRREHGARAQARQTEFPDMAFSALIYRLVAKIYDAAAHRPSASWRHLVVRRSRIAMLQSGMQQSD